MVSPEPFGPPAEPPVLDLAPLVGTYRREGVVITVTKGDGTGHAVYEFVDGMKDFSEPLEIDLVPVSATVFAGTGGRRGIQRGLHAGGLLPPGGRDGVRPHRYALRTQGRVTRVRPRARDPWGNGSPWAPYAYAPTSRRLRSSCVSRRISSRAVPRCTAMTGGLPARL
ncbi:hypothetical protein SAMN02745831_06599 [Streptomyces sp. PgraA7]|nr:hypothetical protein SAMN02745831_06599 [Streptomyces sp. PgraA7]